MGKVIIVDYALGNLRSVAKALEKAGASIEVTSDPDKIRDAKALVLPGVGSFRHGMDNLRGRGILSSLHEAIQAGTPFLGICLGLQLLFSESEEHGLHRGIGLIRGKVRRLPQSLKVPQMGWNQVRISKPEKASGPFSGIPDESYFYFVHSYYVEPEDQEMIIGTTDYGIEFASAIIHDNIFAVQFHPEKSGAVGLKLLENWRNHVG
jgi:glutamine amidotransferase